MTRQTPLDKAKGELEALVEEVSKGEPAVILEKDGQPAAVLVSLADYQRITALKESLVDQMNRMAAYAATQASQEEIEAAIEEAVEEVEAEARKRLAGTQ